MSEEVIDVKPEVVQDENDQLKQLREAAIKVINESNGFVLFAFNDGEVDLGNGQKAKVPKNMLGAGGAIGGGSVSLPFVALKAKALLDQENAARNEQAFKLSE